MWQIEALPGGGSAVETKAAKIVVFFTFSISMLLELNVCFYSSRDELLCEYLGGVIWGF